MSTRRHFLLALGALAVAPPGRAQGRQPPARVGYVTSQTPDTFLEPFVERLRQRGYAPGRDLLLIQRDAKGDLARIPKLIDELIAERVQVIVVANNVAIRAALNATRTIPIVMASSIDPVAAGYVRSLARPGGNVTGVATLQRDLSAKRLTLMREIIPGLAVVGIVWDAEGPAPQMAAKDYEAAARSMGLTAHSLSIRGPAPALVEAIDAARKRGARALIAVSNPTLNQHIPELIDLCRANGLALMCESSAYVQAGALVSYSTTRAETARMMADTTYRILHGANPAELPVEQPTLYELALNARTARELGLTVPAALAARADQLFD